MYAENSVDGTGGWAVNYYEVAKNNKKPLDNVTVFGKGHPKQYFNQSAPPVPNDTTSKILPPKEGTVDQWGLFVANQKEETLKTTPFNNKIKGDIENQFNQPAPDPVNHAEDLIPDIDNITIDSSKLTIMIQFIKSLIETYNKTNPTLMPTLTRMLADLNRFLFLAQSRQLSIEEQTKVNEYEKVLKQFAKKNKLEPDPPTPSAPPVPVAYPIQPTPSLPSAPAPTPSAPAPTPSAPAPTPSAPVAYPTTPLPSLSDNPIYDVPKEDWSSLGWDGIVPVFDVSGLDISKGSSMGAILPGNQPDSDLTDMLESSPEDIANIGKMMDDFKLEESESEESESEFDEKRFRDKLLFDNEGNNEGPMKITSNELQYIAKKAGYSNKKSQRKTFLLEFLFASENPVAVAFLNDQRLKFSSI
jgi:hypothetical protein